MSTDILLLQSVIKSVSVNGFENASIKTIAKEAGVSASTIYCHYENKEDMFEATFMYLAEKFIQYYTSDPEPLTAETQKASMRNLFNSFLGFILENPDEALFYIRYRHSAYYTNDVRQKVLNYQYNFGDATEKIAKWLGMALPVYDAAEVFRIFIEEILLYAEQKLNGVASEESDDLAFESMFGAAKALESALANK